MDTRYHRRWRFPAIELARHAGASGVAARNLMPNGDFNSTAILPVALAVLHRVFGPANIATWHALRQAGAFDMGRLDEYFERWHERFDLFHAERPFLQSAEPRVEPKSLIHLIHPMGNTGTLFSHVNDEAGIALSPAEAARYLLAARCFRTAGLGSVNQSTACELQRLHLCARRHFLGARGDAL